MQSISVIIPKLLSEKKLFLNIKKTPFCSLHVKVVRTGQGLKKQLTFIFNSINLQTYL